MARGTLIFSLWSVLAGLLIAAPQIGGAQTDKNDITTAESRNFDAYLDKDHDVRPDLIKNPNLINDPNYLKRHQHPKSSWIITLILARN